MSKKQQSPFELLQTAIVVVLEKNGFQLEETKTGAVVKDGKAMDVRVYRLDQ